MQKLLEQGIALSRIELMVLVRVLPLRLTRHREPCGSFFMPAPVSAM
jgi:hypothetical protein